MDDSGERGLSRPGDVPDDVRLVLEQAAAALDEARERVDALTRECEEQTEARERLVGVVEAVVSGLRAGLLTVDRSLVVTDCSDRAAALLDVPRSQLVGRELSAVGDPSSRELAELVTACLDDRPSYGVITRSDRRIHAGCASFDAGRGAVAVLQEIQPVSDRAGASGSP
jgi:PAS domain-containing protein